MAGFDFKIDTTGELIINSKTFDISKISFD